MNYENDTIQQAINNGYQKTDPTRFCYVAPKEISQVSKKGRINYVIATWSGDRRKGNEVNKENPIFYLKKHIKALEKAQNLSAITIIIPDNPEEPTEFTDFIGGVGSGFRILRRENKGQSYGSWVAAFQQFREEFDYYIFVEDDYIPAIAGFDSKLVDMFASSQNCGYLCSRVAKYPPTEYNGRPHAAISNGISSFEVLNQVDQGVGFKFGADSVHQYAATPQLEFSWSFLEAGFWLYDYSSHYSAPYQHVGKLQRYGSIKLPPLFIPAQEIA